MAFLRFVVLARDHQSHLERGLIHAAEAVRLEGRLTDDDEAIVWELFGWFNRHLPIPPRFSRSRRRFARPRAISWFKPTASRCIARMRELARVLERQGQHTLQLTIDRPGFVVYEDDWQVVAETFPTEYARARRTTAVAGRWCYSTDRGAF